MCFIKRTPSLHTICFVKLNNHLLFVQVSFRAESDGLIFYNGQDNLGIGDFIALGLEDGLPVFRFNMGGGVSTVKSTKSVQKGIFLLSLLHSTVHSSKH